jgi:hypothetical protein
MVLRCIAALLLSTAYAGLSNGQTPKTKNIVIVTLDGFRWQEVFEGSDMRIASNEKYVKKEKEISQFCDGSELERRNTLMPFLWNVIAAQGQLYGNRELDNKVNCTNHHLISYPGYSEMLVGFKHRKVSSNRKIENPHATVLEIIGNHHHFKNEVAAFATWDAFPFILRESKSDIYVNAGNDIARGQVSHRERVLNELQQKGSRSDSVTFEYAFEYMKRNKPRVTFIGFDETDKYGHAGRYDEYLTAAHRADRMIADLWEWLQSQPEYKDQTTLFITTDHGRGNGRNNWRTHKLFAPGSRHIWFAVIGPDTPAFGEMRIKAKHYQKQVAKTIAAFLGIDYRNEEPVGEVLQTMISLPQGNKSGAPFTSRE